MIIVWFVCHIKTIDELGLFLKSNTSLVGPSEGVVRPLPDRRIDHEIELHDRGFARIQDALVHPRQGRSQVRRTDWQPGLEREDAAIGLAYWLTVQSRGVGDGCWVEKISRTTMKYMKLVYIQKCRLSVVSG